MAPTTSTKKPRIVYLDALRFVSICAVVMLHVVAANINQLSIGGPAWSVFNVLDSCVRWSVPVFLMVSGALFLQPTKQVTLKRILTKNLPRIITAYFFWCAVGALYAVLVDGAGMEQVKNIFINGEYHLWFLQVLALIYLFIPAMRCLMYRTAYGKQALLIFFLLILGINTVFTFVHVAEQPLIAIPDFVSYAVYFYLGYVLSSFKFQKKWAGVLYVLAVISLVVIIIGTKRASVAAGITSTLYYSNFTVFVALLAAAIFLAFKRSRVLKNVSAKTAAKISQLGILTFGVYLAHPLMMWLLDLWFGINSLFVNPALGLPLTFLLTTVLSVTVSYALNRITPLARWIV